MKEPVLMIIEREDIGRLNLFEKTTWGAFANLDSIQTKQDLEDIGVQDYCKNLKEETQE